MASPATAVVGGRPSTTAESTNGRVVNVDGTARQPGKTAKWTNSMSGAALGISMILVGCCANVWTLEVLTKRDPGAGNLITFSQFLLIATEGLINHWQWPYGFAPRVVPLLVYVKITAIFFLTSLLNNAALDYHISIPVHTVFRSSGLTATLLLGRFVYKTRYPMHQVIACMLVSVGILCVTLADVARGSPAPAACCEGKLGEGGNLTALSLSGNTTHDGSAAASVLHEAAEWSVNTVWSIGIGMLSTALFLAAYLGHEQDRAYKTFGKGTWKEVMFYSHLFSLPAFIFVAPDVLHHFRLLASLPPSPLPLPFLAHSLRPSLLSVLGLNLLFQLLCIRGVYMLTTNTNTLTCSLVLTLRKLLSLLLSVSYFGNRFSPYQWMGTAMVFAGVLVYSNNPCREEQWKLLSKSPDASRAPSRVGTPERKGRDLDGEEDTEVVGKEKADGVRQRPRKSKGQSNGAG